jgi:putative addiction module component (TIGR02574 family)
MDPTDTLHTVQSWPLQEQLDFAFRVWDGIVDAGWRPELTEELKAELERRLVAHQADPTRALTGDEVLAQALHIYSVLA